jgi:hypothetical protein
MSEQRRRSRSLFGPSDPSQLATRPDARTTRRLAKLTEPTAPVGNLRKFVDAADPLDRIPTVRYPSFLPDLAPRSVEFEPGPEPEVSGEGTPHLTHESSPFHLVSMADELMANELVTDPAATLVTANPAARSCWPLLLLFVVVVAAGITWLTLGLKVMAW